MRTQSQYKLSRPIDWVFVLLPLIFMLIAIHGRAERWLITVYSIIFVALYIIAYKHLLSIVSHGKYSRTLGKDNS